MLLTVIVEVIIAGQHLSQSPNSPRSLSLSGNSAESAVPSTVVATDSGHSVARPSNRNLLAFFTSTAGTSQQLDPSCAPSSIHGTPTRPSEMPNSASISSLLQRHAAWKIEMKPLATFLGYTAESPGPWVHGIATLRECCPIRVLSSTLICMQSVRIWCYEDRNVEMGVARRPPS